MKPLHIFVESLLDAMDDDQFTPEQVAKIARWDNLVASKYKFEKELTKIYNEIAPVAKEIPVPKYGSDDSITSFIKNDKYYILFDFKKTGKVDNLFICKGFESCMILGLYHSNSKKPSVSNLVSNITRFYTASMFTYKCFELPDNYIWLYDKMVAECNKKH